MVERIIYDGGILPEQDTPGDVPSYSEKYTSFASVYNCFLGKITDDMYLELTPEDTLRDLQNLLKNAIPGFEFPRVIIDDYIIEVVEISPDLVTTADFVVGTTELGLCLVERSFFTTKLTQEEINILAILMLEGWVQRQVSSIELTRQKYSGTDFKMTSQANHLSRLLALLAETQRQSLHMQRLYKRRRRDDSGRVRSNWSVLREVSTFDD